MPFIKGQSGNPNGRPKKRTFRDYWSDTEIKQLVAEVKRVYKNRPEILKLTIEQIFGRPRQTIGLEGGDIDKPIPILFQSDIRGGAEAFDQHHDLIRAVRVGIQTRLQAGPEAVKWRMNVHEAADDQLAVAFSRR